MRYRAIDFVVVALTFLLLMAAIVSAVPNGVDSLTRGKNERYNDSMGGVATQALAGNVTALDITGTAITKYWQGYFGNVSGTIVLSDASNNSLYRWLVSDPLGEIYASRSQAISWANNIDCANESVVVIEDNEFLGVNDSIDVDTVNDTFSRTDHPDFFVGGNPGAMSGCPTTSADDLGTGSIFWEILLQENSTGNIIYTALLDPDNTTGFDGTVHDFQMLVAEPGSGSEEWPNGATTTYYFFVELG